MIGLIRLAVFGFVGLSLLYLLVSVYAKSLERERLEKEWDGDPANEGAPPEAREAHIEAGMTEYHSSLRRRLVVLVYIVPAIAIAIIYYFVNQS